MTGKNLALQTGRSMPRYHGNAVCQDLKAQCKTNSSSRLRLAGKEAVILFFIHMPIHSFVHSVFSAHSLTQWSLHMSWALIGANRWAHQLSSVEKYIEVEGTILFPVSTSIGGKGVDIPRGMGSGGVCVSRGTGRMLAFCSLLFFTYTLLKPSGNRSLCGLNHQRLGQTC